MMKEFKQELQSDSSIYKLNQLKLQLKNKIIDNELQNFYLIEISDFFINLQQNKIDDNLFHNIQIAQQNQQNMLSLQQKYIEINQIYPDQESFQAYLSKIEQLETKIETQDHKIQYYQQKYKKHKRFKNALKQVSGYQCKYCKEIFHKQNITIHTAQCLVLQQKKIILLSLNSKFSQQTKSVIYEIEVKQNCQKWVINKLIQDFFKLRNSIPIKNMPQSVKILEIQDKSIFNYVNPNIDVIFQLQVMLFNFLKDLENQKELQKSNAIQQFFKQQKSKINFFIRDMRIFSENSQKSLQKNFSQSPSTNDILSSYRQNPSKSIHSNYSPKFFQLNENFMKFSNQFIKFDNQKIQ